MQQTYHQLTHTTHAQLYDLVREKRIKLNTIAFNSALATFCALGNWEMVDRVFNDMLRGYTDDDDDENDDVADDVVDGDDDAYDNDDVDDNDNNNNNGHVSANAGADQGKLVVDNGGKKRGAKQRGNESKTNNNVDDDDEEGEEEVESRPDSVTISHLLKSCLNGDIERAVKMMEMAEVCLHLLQGLNVRRLFIDFI